VTKKRGTDNRVGVSYEIDSRVVISLSGNTESVLLLRSGEGGRQNTCTVSGQVSVTDMAQLAGSNARIATANGRRETEGYCIRLLSVVSAFITSPGRCLASVGVGSAQSAIGTSCIRVPARCDEEYPLGILGLSLACL
jgi:hypothetical protein